MIGRKAIERFLKHALPVYYHARLMGWWIWRPVTVGVSVVIVDGDQVLLVRAHSGTRWHLPGGGVKRGETLEQAARREAHEETGCVVEIERLLGIFSSFDEWKSNHVAVFVARPCSPVAVKLNVEIAEARYFPIAAVPPTARPGTHARLNQYLAGGQGLYTGAGHG